jgi:hypothetical protein
METLKNILLVIGLILVVPPMFFISVRYILWLERLILKEKKEKTEKKPLK